MAGLQRPAGNVRRSEFRSNLACSLRNFASDAAFALGGIFARNSENGFAMIQLSCQSPNSPVYLTAHVMM